MSDDFNSPFANPHDNQRYSNSSRSAYERDVYDRDSLLGADNLQRPVRGWTFVSWVMILLAVGAMISLRQMGIRNAPAELPPLDDTVSMRGFEELMVSRTTIGMGELLRQFLVGNENERKKLIEGEPANRMEGLARWARGTFGQRLQKIIVAGDVSGPENAIHLITVLTLDLKREQLKLSDEQRKLLRSLSKLYLDYQGQKFDAPSLKPEERQLILAKLGWYGRVALTPAEAPDQIAREAVIRGPLRFCLSLFILLGVFAGFGLLSILVYLAFAIAAATGALKFGIRPGTPSSGVYAETFALWLIGFIGGQLAVEVSPWPQYRLIFLLVVMFGSLSVLIWPVIRGIPFHQVCEDIGLSWGRAGLFEPFLGFPGYSMMLPMLFIGALIMLVIVFSLAIGPAANPVAHESSFHSVEFVPHPAVVSFLQGDRFSQILLMILACVAAPIVEEIMFRGVLYRHLRDATRSFGWLISGVFSAFWMSFIFAVIHPQPPFAIPALMGIALGCTFVREWRDSLWASMVVHSINNSLIFTILLMASL